MTPSSLPRIDLAEIGLGFTLLALASGLLLYSATRTTSVLDHTLACENDLARQISDTRDATPADLDAIESECRSIASTR